MLVAHDGQWKSVVRFMMTSLHNDAPEPRSHRKSLSARPSPRNRRYRTPARAAAFKERKVGLTRREKPRIPVACRYLYNAPLLVALSAVWPRGHSARQTARRAQRAQKVHVLYGKCGQRSLSLGTRLTDCSAGSFPLPRTPPHKSFAVSGKGPERPCRYRIVRENPDLPADSAWASSPERSVVPIVIRSDLQNRPLS
jgi:hypothetical protein